MSKVKSAEWHGLNKKIRWGRTQIPAFGDEETWRDMLESVGGSRSLGDMNARNMAKVVDHMAREYKLEFSSVKNKRPAEKPYKAKAAGRRSDFYEIPDGTPRAEQKRVICSLWQRLGYDMTSLDTRVKRQFGVDVLLWLHDENALNTLIRDLNGRLARKERQAAQACQA